MIRCWCAVSRVIIDCGGSRQQNKTIDVSTASGQPCAGPLNLLSLERAPNSPNPVYRNGAMYTSASKEALLHDPWRTSCRNHARHSDLNKRWTWSSQIGIWKLVRFTWRKRGRKNILFVCRSTWLAWSIYKQTHIYGNNYVIHKLWNIDSAFCYEREFRQSNESSELVQRRGT